MQSVLYWVLFIFVSFSFLVGYVVGEETTESDMYHRDYKKCVETLPRNKGCEAVYIVFKEVGND